MSIKKEADQTPEDLAWQLLGDRRLTNEIEMIGDRAYIKGEKHGPPAKWAAAPPEPPSKRPEG